MVMRRVLVTGASKGIGAGIAVELGRAGFHVTVHYNTDEHGARKTLSEIKHGDLIRFDVSDGAQCRGALEGCIEKNGAFYGVVSNAGMTIDAAFPMMSEGDWSKVLDTNLNSFYNVIHPCVMPMIGLRQGGRIVTISSVSGVAGNRGQVSYSASKAGIIGATKALALELAKRKITVNCVAPGLIDTDMADVDEAVMKEILSMIPMKRAGTVQEVSSLVAYLMSDAASYITRQVISVNGGMV